MRWGDVLSAAIFACNAKGQDETVYPGTLEGLVNEICAVIPTRESLYRDPEIDAALADPAELYEQ